MSSFANDLVRSIQVADIVDVLLVGAVFFVGITWLRQSSSGSAARRVVVLGFLYASVYLLADRFDLYLMGRLLEVLFFVVLIAAVVVFQTDIRRLLDRVATWSFGRTVITTSASSTVEILAETAAHLAETRTGALIAIRGTEPWDTHVQGGVELDGVVSRPLLYSIFDPESAGHDGAVLMEGDRVTRFAVHLPLALHLPESSRFGGTRHAAALGLATECDALVIVVSEERGTISVAEKGRLTEVSSASELCERLERFWQEHHGESATLSRRWWCRRTLETATMSLGLAALTWLLAFDGADTVYRTYAVPIELRNLPPEWALESDTVSTAAVTLSGAEKAFRRLDLAELTVSFNLAEPDTGENELVITEENLALPSGLHLYDVYPRSMKVVAHRQISLELPVQVRTIGVLSDSFVLAPNPQTVTLLVPVEGVDRPDRVLTQPVDLRQIPKEGRTRAKLALPPRTRLRPDQKAEVEVLLQHRPTPPTW